MQDADKHALPLDLRNHVFGVSDVHVVVGLPDTEAHWAASLAETYIVDGRETRSGFASQVGAWRRYFDPVRFSNTPLNENHPLAHADVIPPSLAGKRIGYQTHRERLQWLKQAGLDVKLGATSQDFIEAANLAFHSGGLLSVIANSCRDRQAIEFTDGFLAIDRIPALRPPSGTGLCDAVGCRSSEVARCWKMALGPSVWVMTWSTLLSAHYWLHHRLALYTRIVQGPPAPFTDQLLATNRQFGLLLQESYS